MAETTGVPDCPKCANDGVFQAWLEAHRVDAVAVEFRKQALDAVFDLLASRVDSAAERHDLAEQVLSTVEPLLQATVWAHWVTWVLNRYAPPDVAALQPRKDQT